MGRKSIADERRTQIILAFYTCVVNHGAAGASIRKIANEAGVLPSTLHHYFTSRNEIIEEAVVYFTDKIFKEFTEKIIPHTDGKIRLSKGIEFLFSQEMISLEATGFFLECCVAARHNSRIKETIADLFARFRGAIMDHLNDMAEFSELAARQKQMCASMIVAFHEGIELQWFADPSAVCLEDALAATRTLIQFFIENPTSI
ncbi:MAG: TetR/AcrR family transcriptional regulator [Desulfobacteraceae bacterium]|nr:TetR/AcrR family transcriptional regulator [Desulfobacteraceae bacterium]